MRERKERERKKDESESADCFSIGPTIELDERQSFRPRLSSESFKIAEDVPSALPPRAPLRARAGSRGAEPRRRRHPWCFLQAENERRNRKNENPFFSVFSLSLLSFACAVFFLSRSPSLRLCRSPTPTPLQRREGPFGHEPKTDDLKMTKKERIITASTTE